MSDLIEEASQVDKLYEFGERLNEAKDKLQKKSDYQGIIDVAKSSVKTKQLAAQLIPRFFKFFPELSNVAIYAHLDLIEAEEIGVRVPAIRGLPLFCKDTPEHLSKIVDILVQLLSAEETVERDAVHKALMSVFRQDVKASLTALFKHIQNVDEPNTFGAVRVKVISFMRDKVFPIKAELLRPQEEMEHHITDLIKKSLDDLSGGEFRMFMDLLKTLSIYGDKAPSDRLNELAQIIEGQSDLDRQFDTSDADHIERLISCLFMALPFFVRGASSTKFLNYLNNQVVPVFDELPEARKLDFLKALAEISPYVRPHDCRQILPSMVKMLKKSMPRRKTREEMNFTHVECLLYAFHHFAHKVPNATNCICGYAVVTGQPSDRLGEDFSEMYKDFTERLTVIEELTRTIIKKSTQNMVNLDNALADAKSDTEKNNIKTQKSNSITELRTCNNILAMAKPLHAKIPAFIGDRRVYLSWKELSKHSGRALLENGKRSGSDAYNGTGNTVKRARGPATGLQSLLVNRALEGLFPSPCSSSSRDGRRGDMRGRGRSGGWRWSGRGRGRNYW